MKYHKQLNNEHDPKSGIFGDCYRTAVACIIDKHPSEVPLIFDTEDDELQSSEMAKYLKSLGFRIIHTSFNIGTLEKMLTYGLYNISDMYWILSGQSQRGFNHAVVCLNDKIIHDPHISNRGLSKPCSDGNWHVEIIVKPI